MAGGGLVGRGLVYSKAEDKSSSSLGQGTVYKYWYTVQILEPCPVSLPSLVSLSRSTNVIARPKMVIISRKWRLDGHCYTTLLPALPLRVSLTHVITPALQCLPGSPNRLPPALPERFSLPRKRESWAFSLATIKCLSTGFPLCRPH
jgi:hypothetical protein